MSVLLEVCVDSVSKAKEAEEKGAGRIELCGRLDLDGLSPSFELLQQVLKITSRIPIHVMVRSREGNFQYSEQEIEQMEKEILALKVVASQFPQRIKGVVFGCLKTDGEVVQIDEKATQKLIAAAKPDFSVTFHRAFDYVSDSLGSLKQLVEMKVDRILTSGKPGPAEKNLELLATLCSKASEAAIIVMPAGGVRSWNAKEIIARTGCKEIHSSTIVTLS